jgi:PAS domain-containing protein
VPYSQLVAGEIVILPFPPNDALFGALARRAALDLAADAPEALEAHLREIYPRALVRERSPLASFGSPAWYAYRDGRFSPFSSDAWWTAPDCARIILGEDGRYLDANPAALALLNTDLEDVLRSKAGSFTAAQYRELVPWLLQLLRDTGELHSTSLLVPKGGVPAVPVEFHLVANGDGPGRSVSSLRRVPLEAVEGSEGGSVTI